MLYKSILVLATIVLFETSCESSLDGKYTVYKVSTTSSEQGFGWSQTNDTIDTYLKHKLMGAKFDVKFKEKYVELHDKGASDPIILAKFDDGLKRMIYKYSEKIGQTRYNFQLTQLKDDQLLFEVVILVPNGNALIFPTQFGETQHGNFSEKVGVAVCYLSKVE